MSFVMTRVQEMGRGISVEHVIGIRERISLSQGSNYFNS